LKPGGFFKRENEENKENEDISRTQVVKRVSSQPISSSGEMITRGEVDAIVAERLEKSFANRKQDVSEESSFGLGSKTIKELKEVAGVFAALKEISSNPLQTIIEQKVGTMAAGVVERSFNIPQTPQNQDWIDRILNSQTGAGFGAALGQRGPELADKLISTFGKEKIEHWGDNITGGRRGKQGTGGIGDIGSIDSGNNEDNKQAEIALIMRLDPNNPEHITAYAASQGNISLDVARKMLMIHQDDFIKQGKGIVQDSGNIVQEYRPPVSYGQGQQLQGEEQEELQDRHVSDDIKARQLEPDALRPQMKPELIEIGQRQEQRQEQEQIQEGLQINDNEADVNISEPDVNISVYLKSMTQTMSDLSEKVTQQNEIISQLQTDLNMVKEKDIERTKKNMERTDEDIFAGVRKVRNIKIGKNVGEEIGEEVKKEAIRR
jgi:hypothetical protein